MSGEEAARALDASRYQSISRRDLARSSGFDEISPELGHLDADAFDHQFQDDPDLALELLAKMAQATDRELAALARRLAGRLSLKLARTGKATGRGVKHLVQVKADNSNPELDIDASLDAIMLAAATKRRPNVEDLRATAWRRPSTAICLLVDRSGSMSGQRLAGAALAAATVSWRAPEEFAILAFSDKVIEVKSLRTPVPANQAVSDVLRLRGHGTTDVALSLRAAKRQLASSSATRKVTVLLSDAEVTTGGDPIPAARQLDELVIVAPSDDVTHAEVLANAVGAKLATISGPTSVLDALRTVLC